MAWQVAHFDPVEFPIFGEGTYVGVGVGLPRDHTRGVYPWRGPSADGEKPQPAWEDLLALARKRLTQVRGETRHDIAPRLQASGCGSTVN